MPHHPEASEGGQLKTLRIRDWDVHFENAASRKLKRLDWVAIPNRMDGVGYTALVDHPHGAAHLGAWIAIVEIASRQGTKAEDRGIIPRGVGGICQTIGRISRLSGGIFQEAIPRLIEIGWLEQIPETIDVADPLDESAIVVGRSADEVAEYADEVAAQEVNKEWKEGNYTHTETCVRAALPLIRKVPIPMSERFLEFWERWPGKKMGQDLSAGMWAHCVTTENEPEVFACLGRYLESSEVSRGTFMNPERWLSACNSDGWKSDWPKPRAPVERLSVEERAKLEHRQMMERNGTK